MITIYSKQALKFFGLALPNSTVVKRLNNYSNLHAPKYQFGHYLLCKNNQFFSSMKNNKNDLQTKKLPPNQIQSISESEFLWKYNVLLNLAGVCTGLLFPTQSLYFILMSNSMIQMYTSGIKFNRVSDMTQKSGNYSSDQLTSSITEIKDILLKILINNGLLIASTILMCMGMSNPQISDYALIWLNFWILFNIKLNNFPQGYYIVLASLLLFELLYFKQWFRSVPKIESESVTV